MKHSSQMIVQLSTLAKQFRQLEKELADVKFRIAQWAKAALAVFNGNEQKFVDWCKADLEQTDAAARNLARLGACAEVASDKRTWDLAGGSTQIQRLVNVDAPKKVVVQVLESVKANGTTIARELRDRGLSAPLGRPPGSLNRDAEFQAPGKLSERAKAKMSDAEALARFIAANLDKLPALPGDLEVVVRMYVPRLPARKASSRANAAA